jgi:uncharacterized protein (TIGR03790 family)
MKRFVLFLAFASTLLASVGPDAPADGREVAVVYNENVPESRDVAEYYAARRRVPANQVIGLKLESRDLLTRDEFNAQLANPLRVALSERKLMMFKEDIIPVRPLHPGGVKYTATASRIRYLLLCYGVPYRVKNDPAVDAVRDEEATADVVAEMRVNGASVDDELMLLPVSGHFRLYGALVNNLYRASNAAAIHPVQGCLMVSRLDGPSPEIARGLVDKAIEAERDGLNGRAYFDLRGLTAGAYKRGDDWIAHAAEVARKVGYETYVDKDPATLGRGFPLSQIAIYAGWYTGDADGPFTLPIVEFMPGAIAYHLHSYSAYLPRDPVHNWVGPLLAKGAAVTLGCVDEPYLELTPDIGVFIERLAVQRFTVGEAGFVCRKGLSWQTIVFGDPLYRPFAKEVGELEAFHRSDPLLAWAVLRKANLLADLGKSADAIRTELIESPLSTNSAIVAEKIAAMFGDRARNRQAVQWARQALALNPSPQQEVRLLRDIAEWLTPFNPGEAIMAYDALAAKFPAHPDLQVFRKRQLQLARDMSRKDLVDKVEAAIKKDGGNAAPAGR